MIQVVIEAYHTEDFTGATILEPVDNYVFFDANAKVSRELFGDRYEGVKKIPDAIAYDLFPEATRGYRLK